MESQLLNDYTFKSVAKFQGIKHLIVNLNKKVLTQSSCYYLMKFYRIYNTTLNSTLSHVPIMDDECLYSTAKDIYNEYFKTPAEKIFGQQFKRLIKLALVRNPDTNSDIIFKILQLSSIDIYNRIIIDNSLIYNANKWIYIFKNMSYVDRMNKQIFYFYLGVILCIIGFNIMIWSGVLITIFMMLYQFSYDISNPIRRLVEQVTSIGRQDNTAENKNETKLTEIKFEYDKDINDLFVMC